MYIWTPRARAQGPQKWISSSLSVSGRSYAPVTTYTQSTWPKIAGKPIGNEYYICQSPVTYENIVAPATKFILHSSKSPGVTYDMWLAYVTLWNPTWCVDFTQLLPNEGFDIFLCHVILCYLDTEVIEHHRLSVAAEWRVKVTPVSLCTVSEAELSLIYKEGSWTRIFVPPS